MKKLIVMFLFAMSITGIANAQKGSNEDCRTAVQAHYERYVYIVDITNKTTSYVSYDIQYPDGSKSYRTVFAAPHETIGTIRSTDAPLPFGVIRVTPTVYGVGNCPMGPVQVNVY